MRRILVASAAVLALLAVIPAHAGSTTGSILVSTVGQPRVQRCAFTGAGSQGVAGWTVSVTPGDTFTLTADGGTVADLPDFDIHFYSELPKCEASATSVGNSTASGDETGTVPAGANVGIIILWAGAPGSSFTYTEPA